MDHPLLLLARNALRHQLAGAHPPARTGSGAPRACFVSLKVGHALRGCIGTLRPTRATVEEEVIENAVAAATRDPRFDPVGAEELERLRISIDLLSSPEPIEELALHDPRRFGLIVSAGVRCGVLLPDLPGVETALRQLEICREKGGIGADERVQLERFTVLRLQERQRAPLDGRSGASGRWPLKGWR
ncbi:MAG: AmmeMemoRadiSam system protein A [Candidatus Lambdaproteobacteria bacterium]|nr:AmmeMemoRadiSam system protein A [Candidatus Lambdaproteobacteria bacterium]